MRMSTVPTLETEPGKGCVVKPVGGHEKMKTAHFEIHVFRKKKYIKMTYWRSQCWLVTAGSVVQWTSEDQSLHSPLKAPWVGLERTRAVYSAPGIKCSSSTERLLLSVLRLVPWKNRIRKRWNLISGESDTNRPDCVFGQLKMMDGH